MNPLMCAPAKLTGSLKKITFNEGKRQKAAEKKHAWNVISAFSFAMSLRRWFLTSAVASPPLAYKREERRSTLLQVGDVGCPFPPALHFVSELICALLFQCCKLPRGIVPPTPYPHAALCHCLPSTGPMFTQPCDESSQVCHLPDLTRKKTAKPVSNRLIL